MSVEKVGRLNPESENENMEGFTMVLIAVLLSFENIPKEIGLRMVKHADKIA